MKPNPLRMALTALVLVFGCGLSGWAKAPQHEHARFYAVSELVAQGDCVQCIGKERSALVRCLGYPSVKLSRDVWAYHSRFRPHSDDAMRDGCRSLLVLFRDDRVSEVYFANAKACDIVQARLRDPDCSAESAFAVTPSKSEGPTPVALSHASP